MAVVLDPNNPSRDLVGSAPIEFRPAGPDLEQAAREAPPGRRYAVLAQAGYWYDAVKFARANSGLDQGAAVAELLAREGLRVMAGIKRLVQARTRAVECKRQLWSFFFFFFFWGAEFAVTMHTNLQGIDKLSLPGATPSEKAHAHMQCIGISI